MIDNKISLYKDYRLNQYRYNESLLYLKYLKSLFKVFIFTKRSIKSFERQEKSSNKAKSFNKLLLFNNH